MPTAKRRSWRDEPTSMGQIGFLKKLVAEREEARPWGDNGSRLQEQNGTVVVLTDHGVESLTKGGATIWIEIYKNQPRKASGNGAEPGYYVRTEPGECEGHESLAGEHMGEEVHCDGTCKPVTGFYVVVENKEKTRTYAKKMIIEEGSKPHWEYAPGLGRSLAEDGLKPMTVQQAAEFGHLHGYCIAGFERLVDPVSVIVGYGEKCAANQGWPYPHRAAEQRAVVQAGRYDR